MASLLRDPSLSSVTVASHLLKAIKEEGLPYDAARIVQLLELVPSSVVGRYQKILDEIRA